MAANLETSHDKGSDVLYDVCCSVCEEYSLYKEGLYYCQKCLKYFCDSCVLTHNKFFNDHSVTAKEGGDNWPVTKTVDDTMELCEEHSTEKLTMFCDDHEKLLCQLCLLHNHRQCSHEVLLAEKCKSPTQPINVAEIESNMERLQKLLVEAVKRSEQNIKSLQTSHEIILEEILDFRRQINDSLDRLQQNTVNELDKLHSSLKNSLEDERKQCETFISKLKLHDAKRIKSPDKSFILCRKYLDQTASAEVFLRKITKNSSIEFQHNNDLEQLLASCIELGKIIGSVDPNKVISVQTKSQYNVRTNNDRNNCTITGICEMSNGNLVIVDSTNQCVKLLDQTYNVIDQVKLPSTPWSICNTSPNDVAVTVCDVFLPNEIQSFRVDNGKIQSFRVDNGKIITIKNLKLNHSCYGIAHHKGDIFVTSGTSLFQYTADGRLVKTLYADKSGFGGQAQQPGTTVKFIPFYATDTVVMNGTTRTINTRLQCITSMKEYENKSLEEIRMEDYQAGCFSHGATGFGIKRVAVSPDGKRIYLTDLSNGRLVTLTMDGAVTATLQDPAFKHCYRGINIHVAARGQVFVIGGKSISQVDTDGKRILATAHVDGWPSSVYFNVGRSKLLVGMLNNRSMTEFKTTI